MSVWSLLQIIFDLSVFAGIVALWLRLRRPPQDDPRLSRGLQLLQTKITVLEDLSDRTDSQVKQLSSLLDQKTRMLQNKVLEAEQQILKIDHSMSKSLEVAEIFQDKIPHHEIVERQRTVEYVRAARMAHSGMSLEEIAKKVSMPREQLELIVKFNREQLMFDESALPEWATREAEGDPSFALSDMNFLGQSDDQPPRHLGDVAKIEKDFRSAIAQVKEQEATAARPSIMDSKVAETLRATVVGGVEGMQPAVMSLKATAQTFREKLAATAEDLLRAQNANGQIQQAAPVSTAANLLNQQPAARVSIGSAHNVVSSPTAQVRKVIFPKIEK